MSPKHFPEKIHQVAVMNEKRRDVAAQSLAHPDQPALERCTCLALSSLQPTTSSRSLHDEPGDDLDAEIEKVTAATQELNARIRQQLSACFPRSTPLSLLLLHVSQREHASITPQSAILRKRQRYHAPVSFLEQVLMNVRRVIRS